MNINNYAGWCLRLSVRLYFAILGVGKRNLLCAGFTDPPKPSGWYLKYIGNRTIEETSANHEIVTTLQLIAGNLSYQGKFQYDFDQGKGNLVPVSEKF